MKKATAVFFPLLAAALAAMAAFAAVEASGPDMPQWTYPDYGRGVKNPQGDLLGSPQKPSRNSLEARVKRLEIRVELLSRELQKGKGIGR